MTLEPTPHNPTLRPLAPADMAAVASLWHRAGQKAYDYIATWQRLPAEDALPAFEAIASHCEVWVAESGGRILGYLALDGDCLDRLYVDPDVGRRGVGTALLLHAQSLRPAGLVLYTHQRNQAARAFYQKHGFIETRYGISPPPESEPDVEMRWHAHRTTTDREGSSGR